MNNNNNSLIINRNQPKCCSCFATLWRFNENNFCKICSRYKCEDCKRKDCSICFYYCLCCHKYFFPLDDFPTAFWKKIKTFPITSPKLYCDEKCKNNHEKILTHEIERSLSRVIYNDFAKEAKLNKNDLLLILANKIAHFMFRF